jgi:hypothetical protein
MSTVILTKRSLSKKLSYPERQHEISGSSVHQFGSHTDGSAAEKFFEAEEDDLVVTLPVDGATEVFRPSGAVEFSGNQPDPTIVVDVVTAFTATMSGLSPEKMGA